MIRQTLSSRENHYRLLVLHYIMNHKNCDKLDVAKALNVNRDIISDIVDELIQLHYVIERKNTDACVVGKTRETNLNFNQENYAVIGIEITNEKVNCLLTDLAGNILLQQSYDSSADVQVVVNEIVHFFSVSKLSTNRILGMGISVPSIIDSSKSIVIDAPSLGWRNIHLKMLLSDHVQVPIVIHNNVNSAALAELWVGQKLTTKHLIYITVGSEIHSTLISNGRLITRYQHTESKNGHFIDKETAQQEINYHLGKFGNLEESVLQLLKKYKKTKVLEKEMVMDAAIALKNMVSLLNTDKIIVAGNDSKHLLKLFHYIQMVIQQFASLQVTLEQAKLGKNAAAIGLIPYIIDYTFATL